MALAVSAIALLWSLIAFIIKDTSTAADSDDADYWNDMRLEREDYCSTTAIAMSWAFLALAIALLVSVIYLIRMMAKGR